MSGADNRPGTSLESLHRSDEWVTETGAGKVGPQAGPRSRRRNLVGQWGPRGAVNAPRPYKDDILHTGPDLFHSFESGSCHVMQ